MNLLLLLACGGTFGQGERSPAPTTGADDAGPGTVVLHRLNRAEYDNTVRDLLGTSRTPAADSFPADDHGEGFDNIASVLTTSPALVELWERAAEDLAEEAMHATAPSSTTRWEAEDEGAVTHEVGGSTGDGWMLWSNGAASATVNIDDAGTWELSARLQGYQAGDEDVRAAFVVDGFSVGDVVVSSSYPTWEEHAVELQLTRGVHSVGVAFLNDYYDPDNGQDRNLVVDRFELTGPLDAPVDNPTRDGILSCEPVEASQVRPCAEQVAAEFGLRALRRPLTEAEVDRYADLVEVAVSAGDAFDRGVELMVHAFLVSPHFLFRVEIDPDPTTGVTHPLGAYELASRLSYFLWSSMPDQELLDLAADGTLLREDVLAFQVERMLADPKAEALVDNLAGQWLYIRRIADARPDPWLYPDFDEDLRASMQAEMEDFFREFLSTDLDLRQLLVRSERQLDDRLANHYGLPAGGLVDVGEVGRAGLLTQGGLLMALSHPDRTSPVKRGKWILEQLLCTEPPPPPPEVEGLEIDVDSSQSVREQMEAHRSDPACSGCHALMDPLGFGLEDFDGVGALRSEDELGFPIDASGELPDGRTFTGGVELSRVLVEDPLLPTCMVRQVTTYALGRGLVGDDAPYLASIEESFGQGGWSFSTLATAIATSEPFLQRSGTAP